MPLLFNFAVECSIRRVLANWEALKLNGAQQLLLYTDINTLGGSRHTIIKTNKSFGGGGKEIGL
jgi:hypothetical protein